MSHVLKVSVLRCDDMYDAEDGRPFGWAFPFLAGRAVVMVVLVSMLVVIFVMILMVVAVSNAVTMVVCMVMIMIMTRLFFCCAVEPKFRHCVSNYPLQPTNTSQDVPEIVFDI